MMRCAAERWERAEMTWSALKAGFRGTYSHVSEHGLVPSKADPPTNITITKD